MTRLNIDPSLHLKVYKYKYTRVYSSTAKIITIKYCTWQSIYKADAESDANNMLQIYNCERYSSTIFIFRHEKITIITWIILEQ